METTNPLHSHASAPRVDDAAVAALENDLRGELLQPGTAAYDAARRVWNGMIDRHPALIARCTGAADVMAAVTFARDHSLPVSVRGGGHNVAGTAVCDDGLVIDTSPMKGIHVDPQARTAVVQPGANWGELDRETQLFGLATPGGEVSQTGVTGLTLGGGLGWLRRKHGLSCDNLLAVDLVTPDGAFRRVSETEHSDLFWALRGGGGDVGVVTAFTFQLHPVGPEVMYLSVAHPLDEKNAPALLREWRDVVATMPDEATAAANLWSVPPLPDVPEELHGEPVLIFEGVYAGSVEEGERVFNPIRQIGTPIVDESGPLPFAAVQSAVDDLVPDGDLYYWKSLYLKGLSDEAIDAIVTVALDRPSDRTLVVLRQLGGAMSRVPAEATAFGDRSAPFHLSLDAIWSDPADSDRIIEWTRAKWDDLQPFSTGGFYVNFPGFWEEEDALQRAAYGGNYDRLSAIKKQYDPQGLFSRRSTPPAAVQDG